jgi:hypothetical protein
MTTYNDLSKSMAEMQRMTEDLRDQVDAMNKALGWGDWESHTVGIIPMRIHGRWYWRGDTVYRRQRMWGLTGESQYKYGDMFDVLKEQYE